MSVSKQDMLPLHALPLRPSTLTLLQKRGFEKLGELIDSKLSGGISTLAAELEVDLATAMKILREVQECLSSPLSTHSREMAEDTRSKEVESTTTARDANPSGLSLLVIPPPVLSANDVLQQRHVFQNEERSKATGKSQRRNSIVSFCQAVDSLLGGGIPLGSLTELAGLPGVGKTQMAMQLAVNARLPAYLGGVQGQTIYIDAEGSLAPERLEQMAQALLEHANSTVKRRRLQSLPAEFSTTERILSMIHSFRVHDEAAQTATLYSLPHWIEHFNAQESLIPVRLIVIDSIAFHYRAAAKLLTSINGEKQGIGHKKEHYLHRTKSLAHLAGFLGDIARRYNLAVVVLNQMTTRLSQSKTVLSSSGRGKTESRLVPALGESWAHATTTRLILSSDSMGCEGTSTRKCTLVKSPSMATGRAMYQITRGGIRGVANEVPRVAQSTEYNSSKKQRIN